MAVSRKRITLLKGLPNPGRSSTLHIILCTVLARLIQPSVLAVLPNKREEWLKPTSHPIASHLVVPVVLAATTVEMKNDYLCKLVHSTLAEHFGTMRIPEGLVSLPKD